VGHEPKVHRPFGNALEEMLWVVWVEQQSKFSLAGSTFTSFSGVSIQDIGYEDEYKKDWNIHFHSILYSLPALQLFLLLPHMLCAPAQYYRKHLIS